MQQPFGYWPNALSTRLPAAQKYEKLALLYDLECAMEGIHTE
jgi:hypothetical protein